MKIVSEEALALNLKIAKEPLVMSKKNLLEALDQYIEQGIIPPESANYYNGR